MQMAAQSSFFLSSGAFAKLRKANIGIVMSVCPSVHPQRNNSAPAGWIFMKFDT
jgi:hypothetical protein